MNEPISSFKATLPNGIQLTWDSVSGFTGELADMLNEDFAKTPGQTHTPPAIIARSVLLAFTPHAKIADFISLPLTPLPAGTLC